MIFNIFFQLFRSSQDSTVPVSLPGPSVAPYPPLRLVPPTTNTVHFLHNLHHSKVYSGMF